MLGDTGVAVHPDDARYAHLVGKTVRLPLVGPLHPDRRRRLRRPGEGHRRGQDHPRARLQRLGRRPAHGLPAINVMDTARPASSLTRESPPSATAIDPDRGARRPRRPRPATRRATLILTLAEEQGWLDGADPETHTVPHGDRSKVAIEPFLTDQWYVDAATLAKPALAAVRDGPHPHPAGARREDLLPLAGEHRALVHLPPALVGAPDPGLVRRLRRARRQVACDGRSRRSRRAGRSVQRARPLRSTPSAASARTRVTRGRGELVSRAASANGSSSASRASPTTRP